MKMKGNVSDETSENTYELIFCHSEMNKH